MRGDINIVNRAIVRGLDDGSPIGTDDRKSYCSQVSGAFNGFLRKRIEYMIRMQQDELANPMGAREQDLFHKGTINALSLLLDWDKEISAELSGYQNSRKEVNQNSPSEDDGGVIITSVL